MRIGIISDIHSNLEALTRSLAALEKLLLLESGTRSCTNAAMVNATLGRMPASATCAGWLTIHA